MTDYRATPEQWADTEDWAAENLSCYSCILELRTRVEVLEDAAQKHIVETSANILALASRVEALEAVKRPASKVYEISKPLKLTSEQAQQISDLLAPNSKRTPNSSQIGRSLVDRVALAISGIEYGLERDEEAVNWASEARAAIREVAAWLIDRRRDDDWLAPFEELADLLLEEVQQ
jgi:hypothetical protein